MCTTRAWRQVLGVEHTVIESMELGDRRAGEEVANCAGRGDAPDVSSCLGYDTRAKPRR